MDFIPRARSNGGLPWRTPLFSHGNGLNKERLNRPLFSLDSFSCPYGRGRSKAGGNIEKVMIQDDAKGVTPAVQEKMLLVHSVAVKLTGVMMSSLRVMMQMIKTRLRRG